MTYREYCKANPIRQSFHTGRYGFARVHGALDLSRCTFGSKQAAGRARRAAWLDYLAEESERAQLLASIL